MAKVSANFENFGLPGRKGIFGLSTVVKFELQVHRETKKDHEVSIQQFG